jgi:hypothetical protein
MACCGQRRGQITTGGTIAAAAKRPQPNARVALYEYTGMTAMTVTGRFSGSQYRFAAPGAKVQVSLRDVALMSGLPNLRRLE